MCLAGRAPSEIFRGTHSVAHKLLTLLVASELSRETRVSPTRMLSKPRSARCAPAQLSTEQLVSVRATSRGLLQQVVLHTASRNALLIQQCCSLQRARELQKEADASNLLFVAGRKYYERGNYEDATMLFVQALKEQSGGGDSRLGGDIQLWLGLAYQVRQQGAPERTCTVCC